MKRCLVIFFLIMNIHGVHAQQLFRQTTHISATLHSISFLTDSDAIAIGSRGTIIGSSDQGSVWRSLLLHPQFNGTLNASYHNDSANGAMVGDSGVIYATVQGYEARLDLPEKKSIYDITFPSYQTSIVAGAQGLAYRSFDSGKTWTKMTLPLVARGVDYHGVDYFDDSTYWLVGRGGTVLYTENAGATWQRIIVPTTNDLYSINFPDASLNGWIVGDQTILYTNDGGDSWFSVPTSENLRKVVGYDSLHAYACGLNGALLSTSDLTTWTPIPTGTTANLYGLDIPDSLYVCGDSGLILSTVPLQNSLTFLVRGATFKKPVPLGNFSEDTGIFIANVTQAQSGDPAYTITITGAAFDNPDFTPVSPFEQKALKPGEYISMKLKFAPSHVGVDSGHVTVTSLEAGTHTALVVGYGSGSGGIEQNSPAENYLKLSDGRHSFYVDAPAQATHISIYNELGQEVAATAVGGEAARLPHELPAGFYFYKLTSNSGVRTGKLSIP